MKKNRLFYRIYSDGECVLDGCTDFPQSITRQDAQLLADGIDNATEALCGKKAAELPDVPETEEPPLRIGKENQPFNFHVLTSDKKGKQNLEFFEAHVGDFFLIKKSPWNSGVSFRKASQEDYEALGNLAPAEDMLKAEYWRGRNDGKRIITLRNHPVDANGNLTDTHYQSLLWKIEQAHSVNYENLSSCAQFCEELEAYARSCKEHFLNAVIKQNAYEKAKYDIQYCKSDCIAHQLSMTKKRAMCKDCQRKNNLTDKYEPEH